MELDRLQRPRSRIGKLSCRGKSYYFLGNPAYYSNVRQASSSLRIIFRTFSPSQPSRCIAGLRSSKSQSSTPRTPHAPSAPQAPSLFLAHHSLIHRAHPRTTFFPFPRGTTRLCLSLVRTSRILGAKQGGGKVSHTHILGVATSTMHRLPSWNLLVISMDRVSAGGGGDTMTNACG